MREENREKSAEYRVTAIAETGLIWRRVRIALHQREKD